MSAPRVIVFGGGAPALAVAAGLMRRGVAVDLVGPTEAARAPALPRGGLPAIEAPAAFAQRLAGEEAPDEALTRFVESAADLVDRLSRLGVPFARDGEGWARRRLPGWEDANAVYVGASTASTIAWALDVELMRLQDAGATLRRWPERELVDLVVVDGRAAGLVLMDRVTGAVEGLDASAVIFAPTGAAGTPLGDAAAGYPELALAAAYRAGAALAGLGRPTRHPTLLAHGRLPQPLSSALRAEGARFWVPRDPKETRLPRDIPPRDRDLFVEEHFGKEPLVDDHRLAGLVRGVTEERGVYDRAASESRGTVYLDISHLPEGHLRARLGDELDAIGARAPRSPYRGPFEVRAGAVDLGCALWVDGGAPERAQRTSLPGLWAIGAAAWPRRPPSALEGLTLVDDLCGADLAAASVAAGLEDAAAEDAVEAARAAAEASIDEERAPDGAAAGRIAHEVAEPLAEAIDDLAFALVPPDELAGQLASLAAEVVAAPRPRRVADRAPLEALDVVRAACAMAAAPKGAALRRWRRGTDGNPEEETP